MELEKALNLTQTYGLATVMLFLVAGFLAWLVYYVLKQNEKREARLIDLTEVHVAALQVEFKKQGETTIEFRRSLSESQRYQREEHERMIEALDKIMDKTNACSLKQAN